MNCSLTFSRYLPFVIQTSGTVRRCKLVLKPAELIAIGDQASRGLTVTPRTRTLYFDITLHLFAILPTAGEW